MRERSTQRPRVHGAQAQVEVRSEQASCVTRAEPNRYARPRDGLSALPLIGGRRVSAGAICCAILAGLAAACSSSEGDGANGSMEVGDSPSDTSSVLPSMPGGGTQGTGAQPGDGAPPVEGAPSTGAPSAGAPTTDAPVTQPPTVTPPSVTMGDGSAVDCSMLQRPATPLRRLTRYEYDNSVRDLLGTQLTPADSFPPDEESGGFSNNALVLTVAGFHAEEYTEAAEALAKEAVGSRLNELVACDVATEGEDACALAFVERFGRSAFRRPLGAEERDMLMAAYAAGRTGGSFAEGIEVVIRAALQSPNFLYRIEFTGTDGVAGGTMVRTNAFETAARLSYLLWASTPDEGLLDAAMNGELDTPEQIATRARAMLADEKARPAVHQFFRQWFGLSALGIKTKSAEFPLWSDEMRAAMYQEADAVMNHMLWGAEPTLTQLLTASVGLPVGPLAELYGVPEASTVAALPAEQRSGILTLPAFLSVQAHPDQTSPVLRGKFVRAQLLCDPPEPPPPDFEIKVPDPVEGGTARERFSAHSDDAQCNGCHQLMDPIGFAFETYDAMGVYRTTDGGRELDLSGNLVLTDVDGPFNGVQELAAKLTQSDVVKDCVASQWYRFAVGRADEHGDACSLSPLQEAFQASGGNLMELLVAITQTEAFLYRRALTAQELAAE